MSKELFTKLSNHINNLEYVVDDWLLAELDHEWAIGNYSKRKNIDALALEFILYKMLGYKKPKSWRYDLKLSESIFIDFKRRPKISNNASLSTKGNLEASVKMGCLTHIAMFTQNIEHDYKIGDILTFQIDGYIRIEEAFNKACSMTGLKSFKLLSKNCLQSAENVL